MNLNMNAWLQVAAASWLFLQFAPRITWLPSNVNPWVYSIGGVSCALVILSEVVPAVKSIIDTAMSKVKR